MLWVKLDCAYYDHAKFLRAGPLAEVLWVRALAWANRNRTRESDGLVPVEVVHRLGAFCSRLTIDGDSVSPLDLADALVREGLWLPVAGGWAIHDYTEYQRTLDELDELAEKRSDAGRKGAESRWGDKRDGKRDGKPIANAMAEGSQPGWPGDAPSPSTGSSLSSVVVDVPGTAPQPPDDVWIEYARLKRSSAKQPVRNIAAFDRKTIENAKAELGALAERWWARFDLSASQLAAALVDGKPGPYWTERKEPA